VPTDPGKIPSGMKVREVANIGDALRALPAGRRRAGGGSREAGGGKEPRESRQPEEARR
jgi:DNA repair protein RadA/Sms